MRVPSTPPAQPPFDDRSRLVFARPGSRPAESPPAPHGRLPAMRSLSLQDLLNQGPGTHGPSSPTFTHNALTSSPPSRMAPHLAVILREPAPSPPRLPPAAAAPTPPAHDMDFHSVRETPRPRSLTQPRQPAIAPEAGQTVRRRQGASRFSKARSDRFTRIQPANTLEPGQVSPTARDDSEASKARAHRFARTQLSMTREVSQALHSGRDAAEVPKARTSRLTLNQLLTMRDAGRDTSQSLKARSGSSTADQPPGDLETGHTAPSGCFVDETAKFGTEVARKWQPMTPEVRPAVYGGRETVKVSKASADSPFNLLLIASEAGLDSHSGRDTGAALKARTDSTPNQLLMTREAGSTVSSGRGIGKALRAWTDSAPNLQPTTAEAGVTVYGGRDIAEKSKARTNSPTQIHLSPAGEADLTLYDSRHTGEALYATADSPVPNQLPLTPRVSPINYGGGDTGEAVNSRTNSPVQSQSSTTRSSIYSGRDTHEASKTKPVFPTHNQLSTTHWAGPAIHNSRHTGRDTGQTSATRAHRSMHNQLSATHEADPTIHNGQDARDAPNAANDSSVHSQPRTTGEAGQTVHGDRDSRKRPKVRNNAFSRSQPLISSNVFAVASIGPPLRAPLPDARARGTVRTTADLGTPAGQKFVTLQDNAQIQFSVITPEAVSRKRVRVDGSQCRYDASLIFDQETVRNKRQRTAKQPKECQPVKTILRINRPVRTKIIQDVWKIICDHSEPAALLKLRLIGPDFRNYLKDRSLVWRRSRQVAFDDEDMPDPPPGMTEEQFAELFAGRGCQMRNCPKPDTKKVYWAFRGRFCSSCIEALAQPESFFIEHELSDEETDLLDLLVGATIQSGKYNKCRVVNSRSGRWETTNAGTMFLKRDVQAIKNEYRNLLEAGSSPEEVAAWKEKNRAKTEVLAIRLSAIEEWFKKKDLEKERNRTAREIFYQRKAREMKPPMEKEVLLKMDSYHLALNSNSPPTDKSWDILEKKISPFRAEAERLVFYDKQRDLHRYPLISTPDLNTWSRLRVHREGLTGHGDSGHNGEDEKKAVLGLARTVLDYVKELHVADEDFVLLVLRQVYRRFQESPEPIHGMNADEKFGIYRLTLDDVRLIVKMVIEPEINDWEDQHRQNAALSNFKCVNCPRADCKTRYDISSLFKHIYDEHANRVGEGLRFSMFAKPFPHGTGDEIAWYTIEWPRNLPIAAGHHDVTREKWDPDAEVPYVYAKPRGTVSAFAGRQVDSTRFPLTNDFKKDLVCAARVLSDTNLNVEVQTRIALQFALDRLARHTETRPPLGDFNDSIPDLQSANPKLGVKYICGVCRRDPAIPPNSKWARCPVRFSELKRHFKAHHGGKDWTKEMMYLPSDVELWDAITEEDKKLAKRKQEILEVEEKRRRTAKKRNDHKASVFLSTRRGEDVFGELFPKLNRLWEADHPE